MSDKARTRSAVSILVGAWLLLSLLVLPGCEKLNGKEVSERSPVLVEVAQVEKSTKNTFRRFSGYAHPWESHGVGFLVAGRVTALPVEQGQLVSKGSLLATLSAEDYKLVEQLANAQLEALEPNYHRVDSLVEKEALPQSALDKIKAQYDAAVTQKKQAQRQVKYTRLNAPITGVVHELRTSVGQIIGQGMPAVVLLDIDRIKVRFGVTQSELEYFEKGQDVTVDFPGVKEKVEGRIYHIDFVADSMTRTYDVVVEVQNADHVLRPSMLAQMTIIKESLNGYFLPIGSLMQDISGKHYVMLVDTKTNIVEKRVVSIGRRFEEYLEITEGLTGGESVVIRGNNFAKAGDKVVVK